MVKRAFSSMRCQLAKMFYLLNFYLLVQYIQIQIDVLEDGIRKSWARAREADNVSGKFGSKCRRVILFLRVSAVDFRDGLESRF